MEVKLIVANGKHAGTQILVQQSQFLIGRGEDCQLRPGSEQVSRHHCALLVQGTAVFLRDFGSKNGTFVNGERVEGQRELKSGDRLRVALLEFDLLLSTGIGGKKKPKVQNIQEAAARTVQSAADEDLDVSQWIDEEATLPESTAADTQKLMPGTTAEVKAQTPEATPETDEKDDKKDSRHSRLFDAHSAAKPTGASSRQAAADVLRQLFQKK